MSEQQERHKHQNKYTSSSTIGRKTKYYRIYLICTYTLLFLLVHIYNYEQNRDEYV